MDHIGLVYGLGFLRLECKSTRTEREGARIANEAGRVQAGSRIRKELDLVVHGFLYFTGFLLSGNVYEWSTLKLMLHTVGWQAQ